MKATHLRSGLIGFACAAISTMAAAQSSISVSRPFSGPAVPEVSVSSSPSVAVGPASSGPSITWIGSGCPAADDANYHFEGNILVVDFSKMVASKGPGISLIESRKTCSITVDLKVPGGLSYALGGYTANGSDDLSETDTRTLTVTDFFQGQGQTISLDNAGNGPANADFHATHWNSAAETLWSPCNEQRAQTITVALRVGGTDRATAASSSLDSIRLPLRLRLCVGELQR